MNRRNWMRNITMAIAASLVPKILQPSVPELVEDKEIEVEVVFSTYVFKGGVLEYKCPSPQDEPHTISMKESEYYFLKHHPRNKDNALHT